MRDPYALLTIYDENFNHKKCDKWSSFTQYSEVNED